MSKPQTEIASSLGDLGIPHEVEHLTYDGYFSVDAYDKVRLSVTSKSKSKKHRPNTGSNLSRNGLIRARDWSMLLALLLLRNTLTHFVIPARRRRRAGI